MNKHQAYWSVMGNEPSEKSVKTEDLQKLEKQLKVLFNKYDKTEILSLVRKVYEEVL
jgi:hypothetical protein